LLAVWQWLLAAMTNGLEFFFQFTQSYGLAIVLLTIAIRLVLVPFTLSQTQMSVKMQAIQPELEEIKRRYKDNPEKMQRAQLDLWRKHNINPLAGCLPLLLQMPFLIAFFRVLYSFDFPPGTESFLWIPDLAKPDPFYILAILAAATTYWQTKISSVSTEGPQKSMLYVFPIMIAWFSATYASGLSLYWVISNIFSIVQQYLTPRPGPRTAKGESS
jgi:YidC/Oxa1 family membrane protein insertase